MGDGASEPPIDPGWHDAWKGIFWTLTMFRMQQRVRRSQLPALVVLRRTFVSFVASLVLFGVVLALLGSTETGWSEGSAATAGAVIVGLGLVLQFVVARFLDPPLPCGTPEDVAAAYRTKFFLKVAFAESPALFAFTLSFITGFWWVYLFGLVPAAVGLARVAPTRTAIEREWRDLDARDCGVNLLAALMAPIAPR